MHQLGLVACYCFKPLRSRGSWCFPVEGLCLTVASCVYLYSEISLLRPFKIKTISLVRAVFSSPKWLLPYNFIFSNKKTPLIESFSAAGIAYTLGTALVSIIPDHCLSIYFDLSGIYCYLLKLVCAILDRTSGFKP